MPMGLCNSSASFQHALHLLLNKFRWKTCLIYIDDVIIYSKTVEEHISHVDEISSFLVEARVTLKINKCFFFNGKWSTLDI